MCSEKQSKLSILLTAGSHLDEDCADSRVGAADVGTDRAVGATLGVADWNSTGDEQPKVS